MEKKELNGVEINTVVKIGKKKADMAKVASLREVSGKFEIDVPDMLEKVKSAIDNLTEKQILKEATKQVYIRESDKIRRSYQVAAETAGTSATAHAVTKALVEKYGYTEEAVRFMSPEEKINALMSEAGRIQHEDDDDDGDDDGDEK